MLKRIFEKIFLILILFISIYSNAQNKLYTISGRVVEKNTSDAIPYATVAYKSKNTDNLLGGTTTSEDGSFILETDSSNLTILISFIGYEKMVVNNVKFTNNKANIGTIKLIQGDKILDEIVVQGEKSTVEFKLDKKVFNVGQDISSAGMGAMEVLNNVPSVNVDIEGQITLRGNSGVQILINGKPSVLSDEGSNALGTITADMIESIEVITNPSAKYEAGGTSGIINVILKKEEKKGVNGSISLNTGIPTNHSVGISLNKRTDKFNLFTQFGVGRRSMPSYSNSINENLISLNSVETNSIQYRNENFYNLTLGTDYYINDLNVITLSGNFALEDEDQPSKSNFTFLNANSVLSEWERKETTEAINPKYQYDLQYKREFKNNKDHVLMASTLGKLFQKDQSSLFENTYLDNSASNQNQETNTNFYQKDYIFKLDYTNPISKKINIETGAQYEINDVGNNYNVLNEINNVYVIDSNISNNFEYDQQVLGVYGTGSYEQDKWGVKAGIRTENTQLQTLLVNTNQDNSQNYTNFFPSFHSSYKISKFFSLQAGYSKRIYRPRLWDLNPFFNIRNNYNIRRGNPELKPEYADSYEFTGIFVFEKFFINSSIYHLYTTDLIDRVSFSDGNITTTLPLNIGTRKKTGLELNGKYSPAKWLTFNGDWNYGYFNREGTFQNTNFDFNSNQWSSKLTTKCNLKYDFDVEVTANYQSKYETVQGSRSGFIFLNTGIRKKLWKGKSIINFNINDVFASRIRENIVNQEDLYIYTFSKRGRFFTLGLSYSFGKGEAISYSGGRRH